MEDSSTHRQQHTARARLFGATALALVFAHTLAVDPYHFVYDDGGITLRYAARLARGARLRVNTSGTELLSSPYGLPAFEYGGPVFAGSGLNSRPDPAHARSAAYEIVGPLEPGGRRALARKGRRLVAAFLYDARGPLYAVLARDSSEVVACGVAHVPPGWEPGPLVDPDGWLTRARSAPLAPGDLGLTCRRWRDRLARVESGAIFDGATSR